MIEGFGPATIRGHLARIRTETRPIDDGLPPGAFQGALARAGATIVSGMAVGIDATAHRAALDTGGRTAAVLGTGVDVPYPAGHRALHQQIRKRGLIVSEHPPGTKALPGCFPQRNRI